MSGTIAAAPSEGTTTNAPRESLPGRVAMNRLLILGLILRGVVFLLASPFNADNHFEVIQYIARTWTLPATNVLQQSHHPPLYHVLMATLYDVPWPGTMRGALWPIHLVSLLLSCANLIVIRRLMDHPIVSRLASRASIRIVAFALVATHAQFIVFGSYISNDALAQLLGTLQFAALLAYLQKPTWRTVMFLAVSVGVGLLTKGTFLLTGLALAPIVARHEWTRGGIRRALIVTTAFCAVWSLLGCYKYVDNIVRVGRPLAYILDLRKDPGYPVTIWRGPATIFDVEVTKLIRHPVVRPSEPTSYPLTLYATFWYAHFGDQSFRGNVSGYESVGRLTYAVAVVPTLVFVFGIGVTLAMTLRWLRGEAIDALPRAAAIASLALFATNLLIVVGAGVKFDRWDSFQSRLLFPSAMPMVCLLMVGLRCVARMRWLSTAVLAFCWATAACGVLYLLVELALARHLLDVDESILFENRPH